MGIPKKVSGRKKASSSVRGHEMATPSSVAMQAQVVTPTSLDIRVETNDCFDAPEGHRQTIVTTIATTA